MTNSDVETGPDAPTGENGPTTPAAERAREFVEAHPLATAAAAVATGALIGVLLPRVAGRAAPTRIAPAVGGLFQHAAKAIAAAETARTIVGALTSAGSGVKASAKRIADHAPHVDDIKHGAGRAVSAAEKVAGAAGDQVVRTIKRVRKAVTKD